MKKIISLAVAVVLVMGVLCSCSCSTSTTGQDDGKIQIVATIFPEYDWVKNILGNNPANAELTLLLDDGVDLHSFQPSAQDILKVSTCDMFIYVGGESDKWVDDAIKEATNKNMKVINLMDVLGNKVVDEEVVEGMQKEEEHEDEGKSDSQKEHEHEHEKEGETEKDEHVWLSIENAKTIVSAITKNLGEIDSANKGVYEANANSYIAKLQELDTKYKDVTSKSANKTILFGDRFPFRYLTDEYGLKYYAAFVGCSAETEASFETITFLAKKVDELNLHLVLTIDGSDQSIAKTIVNNTKDKNQKILTLNSMQSATLQDLSSGATYLSIMEANLATLEEALK